MVDKMGRKIREHRIALEMTLAEFGDKIGVGASTVRKWETGYIKDMRSDKIQRVAEALGVTPAYLMGWDESQNVQFDNLRDNNGIIGQANAPVTINGGEPIQLSKEESELLRVYKELGIRGRLKLLSTALDLEAEEANK